MSKVLENPNESVHSIERKASMLPKKRPMPKFKKASKALIAKQLGIYEEWLQLQRDGKIVFTAGDAVDWIREDRSKDYDQ